MLKNNEESCSNNRGYFNKDWYLDDLFCFIFYRL